MVGRTLRLATLACPLHVTTAEVDGKVFVARDTPPPADGATDDSDDGGEEFTVLVSRPPCAWEYAMVNKVLRHLPMSTTASRHPRLIEAIEKSLPRPVAAGVFYDSAIAVFCRADGYTMQDVIDMHVAMGKPVDETLVMYVRMFSFSRCRRFYFLYFLV